MAYLLFISLISMQSYANAVRLIRRVQTAPPRIALNGFKATKGEEEKPNPLIPKPA